MPNVNEIAKEVHETILRINAEDRFFLHFG